MSKKARLPQSRRHIFVYDEDWDFIERWYGISSPHPIGVGRALREIIHQRVEFLKAKQAEKIDQFHSAHENEEVQP